MKKPITSDEIRTSFLTFFEERNHVVVDSSPLIPKGDKTLLFTNAGMNQFKDVLLGVEERDYKRAASCQVCIRAGGKHNDLDEVGKDGRHNTLFEMLGNWSFGDYFKQKAIELAWEYCTDILQLPEERLFATVYKTDDESYALWRDIIKLPEARISRLGSLEEGDEENFWSMGPTGPCGPCSEIYLDMGAEQSCGRPDCAVGCDCDRYLEIWNLVFMESNRSEDGSLTPLAFQSVDTGMGMERVASILQGKFSNFDTDLFHPILEKTGELAKAERENPRLTRESYNVIADHIRSLTFTVAEGAQFSNEGRGYVLRRILRRAMRHGMLIGIEGAFLHKVVPAVIEKMGPSYPALPQREQQIAEIIHEEEERFLITLDRGMSFFHDLAAKASQEKKKVIAGKDAFHLYDTFGFPVDLTEIMAEERKLSVDMDAFQALLEEQRARSKKAAKFYDDALVNKPWTEVIGGDGTEFLGYDQGSATTAIRRFRETSRGLEIVVEKSPLYVEKGGQRSDTGRIEIAGQTGRIKDVLEEGRNIILLTEGVSPDKISQDANVTVSFDTKRRSAIARNHTATHLLHMALREKLGNSVQQAGSMVDEDYFTFDFRYGKALSEEEVTWLERRVNSEILENHTLETKELSYDAAVQSGAIALFEEQYGDAVRVVDIGKGVSRELCGGTHVQQTGDIGVFFIISEAAVSAGIRRITAHTGYSALRAAQSQRQTLARVAETLGVPNNQILGRTQQVVQENKALQKELSRSQKGNQLELLIARAKKDVEESPIPHLAALVPEAEIGNLKDVSDKLVEEYPEMAFLLATHAKGKTTFLIRISDKLISQGMSAGDFCKKVSTIINGRGGGKAPMATGGAPEELSEESLASAFQKALAD